MSENFSFVNAIYTVPGEHLVPNKTLPWLTYDLTLSYNINLFYQICLIT